MCLRKGLAEKPVVTVWNKIDTVPERKEFLKYEALKRPQTVALSAKTGEGIDALVKTLETTLAAQMVYVECFLPYLSGTSILDTLHRYHCIHYCSHALNPRPSSCRLSVLEELKYLDDLILVRGKVPMFLREQLMKMSVEEEMLTESQAALLGDGPRDRMVNPGDEEEIDWVALAKGRHSAKHAFDSRRSPAGGAALTTTSASAKNN